MLGAAKNAAWFAAFAFVAAFLVLIVMHASQHPSKQQEQNAQPPHGEQDKADPKAKKIRQDESGRWGNAKEKIKNRWRDFIEFAERYDKAIVALGTGFIALFTVILAFATLFLWGATRDLVDGADETAKRQLRAYIYVDKATVALDGNNLRGVVDIKNSGQTPAYDLTVVSRLESDEAGKPYNPRALELTELSSAIVGPGGIVSPQSVLTVPPDNTVAIPAFKDGRGTLYLIGQGKYRDAFDRIWVLDFRLRSYAFESSRGIWILQPTETGNSEHQKK